MSKSTELLEAAVADIVAIRGSGNKRPSARQRAAIDRAFARIMAIVAPRVRHFIRQYGLTAHREDAEQVCAIGVHRAIEAYDPAKALFTTFVNWQLRGELQGLRFRLMDDQRPSARKVRATTISLHDMDHDPEGNGSSIEALIEDEDALERTEARAADHMAEQTGEALLGQYVRHLRTIGMAQLKRAAAADRASSRRMFARQRAQGGERAVDPCEIRKLDERIERDREIVRRHLLSQGDADLPEPEAGLTRERIRQITRRAARIMGELAGDNPRFEHCGRPTAVDVRYPPFVKDGGPAPHDGEQSALPGLRTPPARIRRLART